MLAGMPARPGSTLVLVGGLLIALGVLWNLGWLSWFGRLPGDVRIEGEHARVYVPITSMLLVSLALGALSWVVRRLLG
jgi:hypothetical protein